MSSPKGPEHWQDSSQQPDASPHESESKAATGLKVVESQTARTQKRSQHDWHPHSQAQNDNPVADLLQDVQYSSWYWL